MKKCLSLLLLTTIYLNAMNDFIEDVISPKDRLQLQISNKKTTAAQFAVIFTKHPKLYALTVDGHTIEQFPTQSIVAAQLVHINLSNGPLKDKLSIGWLLTKCPQLQECTLANNQLTTLNEGTLPVHEQLTKLVVSKNSIESVNFTTLHNKLPNLAHLDLSECPLSKFEIADYKATDIIPTVNLKNTQLPDNVKKEILKHASEILHGKLGTGVYLGSVTGGMLCLIAAISTMLIHPPMSDLEFEVMGGTAAASIFLVGPCAGYFAQLASTKPEAREEINFKPIFDDTFVYNEKEVTSAYQRFVRNFPYFDNNLTCNCPPKKSGYIPLKNVTEQAQEVITQ